MAGIIASKTGFYLVYIFVFVIAVVLVANYSNVENKCDFNLDSVKDSGVINRVVKCLSEENKFGEINEAKLTQDNLKQCFGDRYSFIIELKKLDGLDKDLELGKVSELKQVKRYVLVDKKSAVLEIGYNVA